MIELGFFSYAWKRDEEPFKTIYEKFLPYKNKYLNKRFTFRVKTPLKFKSIEIPTIVDNSPLLVIVKRRSKGGHLSKYLFAVDKYDLDSYIKVIKKINVKERRLRNESGKLRVQIFRNHI